MLEVRQLGAYEQANMSRIQELHWTNGGCEESFELELSTGYPVEITLRHGKPLESFKHLGRALLGEILLA